MANRIRELREEAHMTQVRLSIELEVAQETVSAYENERHYPSFIQLARMSEIFHASIDYIMGLSGIRQPEEGSQSEQRQRLESIVNRMNARQLELMTAYARGLLNGNGA